ncbi:hypothetical protein Fot_10255 [Forsythia ovata]|uniref:Uncharacterized protein n=1 Tax=Forsythia ovata TaxID=205694 RepID=A0ABD1WH02_9LAMI
MPKPLFQSLNALEFDGLECEGSRDKWAVEVFDNVAIKDSFGTAIVSRTFDSRVFTKKVVDCFGRESKNRENEWDEDMWAKIEWGCVETMELDMTYHLHKRQAVKAYGIVFIEGSFGTSIVSRALASKPEKRKIRILYRYKALFCTVSQAAPLRNHKLYK